MTFWCCVPHPFWSLPLDLHEWLFDLLLEFSSVLSSLLFWEKVFVRSQIHGLVWSWIRGWLKRFCEVSFPYFLHLPGVVCTDRISSRVFLQCRIITHFTKNFVYHKWLLIYGQFLFHVRTDFQLLTVDVVQWWVVGQHVWFAWTIGDVRNIGHASIFLLFHRWSWCYVQSCGVGCWISDCNIISFIVIGHRCLW